MTENERIEFKVYLDRRSMDFYIKGAKEHGTSVSGFMRLIPRLLTPDESLLIDKLRTKEVPIKSRNSL